MVKQKRHSEALSKMMIEYRISEWENNVFLYCKRFGVSWLGELF